MIQYKNCCFFFCINLFFVFISIAYGDVVVFDRVTTIGTPIFLKALTKGRLFPQGGRLVYFYIDNTYIGKNLSGGDGYALLKYDPQEIGVKWMEARSNDDRGDGLIFVTEKNKKMILIEILGGLRETIITEQAVENSKTSVKTLAEKYGIIYLVQPLGMTYLKKWLEKEKFSQSPVLPWNGPELITSLKENGLNLHAIIGSADLLSEVSNHIENRYSFEETEDGKTVEDWGEILKLLGF